MEPTDSSLLHQQNREASNFRLPYSVRVTVGKLTVTLIEQTVTVTERLILVEIDGRARGTVQFSPYYTPSLGVGDRYVFVWGGYKIHVFSKLNLDVHVIEHDDEVHWVFEADEILCVVSELSLSLIQPLQSMLITSFSHDEIILDCKWDGEIITLRDLQDRVFSFQVTNQSIQLYRPTDKS